MGLLQASGDGLLVLTISGSTQRYYRRKAEQVHRFSPGQLSHSLAPRKDASKRTSYLLLFSGILIWGSTF